MLKAFSVGLSKHVQIRGGIADNSKIFFFLISQQNVVTPHQNCIVETSETENCLGETSETVLMMGNNIGFYKEMWIIILKLSLLTLLFWSTGLATYAVLKKSSLKRSIRYA